MAAIFDTILQGFTSARKNTQRNLSFGFVFTLVCFFYVVEPYFLYSSHQREAVERREQIHSELEQFHSQLRQIQAVNRQTQQALVMIHERIRAYPDHLNQVVLPQIRDHFYAIHREEEDYQETWNDRANLENREYPVAEYDGQPTGQADQFLRMDNSVAGPDGDSGTRSEEPVLSGDYSEIRSEESEIGGEDPTVQFGDPEVQVVVPGGITEFADAVNWYVRNWFQQIIDDLYTDIVEPIQQNEVLAERDLFENVEETGQLEVLTFQAVDAVSGHLDTVDPDFWHSYEDGKVATVGRLQGVIDRSFEPVTARLDDFHQMISESIAEMQGEMDTLAEESKTISASLEHLNERIESMSSPFGAIPLRTTELIALFPVLIVLIMVFTVISLAKSVRLFTELWQQYRADGRNDVREFQLYTDCWFLPPWSSPAQPALLILYALAMSGIYIYSCYLIWSEPGVFRFPGMGEEAFRRPLFLVAYAAGFMVMAGTIWAGYKKLEEVPELKK